MRRSRGPITERVKDLLSLHAGERRGFLLLFLILLLLTAWTVHQQWFRAPDLADLEPLRRELDAWALARAQDEAADSARGEPFPFDPNTLERGEWLALGFSERQVEGIGRYLAKGGQFRVKLDLARLYSLRPGQYERLEPFILLPDSLPHKGRPPRQRNSYPAYADRGWNDRPAREARPIRPVEVNTADSTELVALPGIGPSFARGILRYRERLGGFLSMDQLAEVPVLRDKPDALERMGALLVIDTLAVRRIPINTCTVEELAAHPYARWNVARPLIAFRTHHGPFREVADIKGCVLVNEDVFRKLAPYLSVE